MTFDPRHRSRVLLDGPDRSGARAYMRAVGFGDEDFQRPLVGVGHCWTDVSPCNVNHRKLAEEAKRGIRDAGGTPVEFCTISVTDGIAMGTEAMKASLVSREVIADSVELFALGHLLDALVLLSRSQYRRLAGGNRSSRWAERDTTRDLRGRDRPACVLRRRAGEFFLEPGILEKS